MTTPLSDTEKRWLKECVMEPVTPATGGVGNVLSRLQDRGLLQSSLFRARDVKKRTYYATSAGRKALTTAMGWKL